RVTHRRPITSGGHLGRHEHCHDAIGSDQFERPFDEGHRQIGPIPVSAASAPPSVSARQLLPLDARNLLGTKPWRGPAAAVEALGCENVGEMAGVMKPGELTIAVESPSCAADGSKLGPLLGKTSPELRVDTSLAAEQVS